MTICRRPILCTAILLSASATMPARAQEVIDLPSEDRLLTADFEEVYRVGSITGEEWELFTSIAGLAFDARGYLYVLDRSESDVRVVVVDDAGGLATAFGRSGEGPTEFLRLEHFAVWPDGRTIVIDRGHGAYKIFGPDGTFGRAVRIAVQNRHLIAGADRQHLLNRDNLEGVCGDPFCVLDDLVVGYGIPDHGDDHEVEVGHFDDIGTNAPRPVVVVSISSPSW